MTKPLKPTQRQRNRYLVFELACGDNLSSEDVGRAIWSNSLRFLGELGVSRSGLRVIDFDEEQKKGVVKCNKDAVDEVRASLALVKEIRETSARITVTYVSGTIKNAKQQYA